MEKCGNAEGAHKLKALVMYHSENLLAVKGYMKHL
jgi:hypothetical protein